MERRDRVAKLRSSGFGIVCLTPRAAGSEWVMFEAGALAMSFDETEGRRVTPLLLGVRQSEVPSPLTSFNATNASRDDIRRLVGDLNELLTTPLRVASLETVFEQNWDDNRRYGEPDRWACDND